MNFNAIDYQNKKNTKKKTKISFVGKMKVKIK